MRSVLLAPPRYDPSIKEAFKTDWVCVVCVCVCVCVCVVCVCVCECVVSTRRAAANPKVTCSRSGARSGTTSTALSRWTGTAVCNGDDWGGVGR